MSEWTKVCLGTLGRTFSGLSGKSKDDFGQGRPYVPYLNIFENSRIDIRRLDHVAITPGEKQNAVQYGDLFFTTSSETVEDVGMTSVLLGDIEDTYLNSFCFGFRLHNFDTLLPEFSAYLFRGQKTRKLISGLGQGSTRYNLPKTILLERLELDIPPLPEQRKIARILTTLDELIEKTEALIAKYQAIKQGMMHDLFTRGVDSRGHLRPTYDEAPELYKESELGWIPREWDVRHFVEIAEVKGGKRMPVGEPFADGRTPFPYIRVSDMLNGSVDPSNIEYVPPNIEPLIRAYKIAKDDLYISIAGVYLGLVGTVPDCLHDAQLTENAAKIVFRDNEAQSKDYVSFFFNSPLFAEQLWIAKGIGAGVPKLPLYQIEKFAVPLPSKAEQLRIVARIDALSTKIDDESESCNKLRVLKTGLMQDLLTGKVRVKVDEAGGPP